ncbi:Pex12 amino terminal region-domain-containing protein [Aspergillus venezuelensis]
MNRTLMRVPWRSLEVIRAPRAAFAIPSYTLLSPLRLRSLTTTTHLSTEQPLSSSVNLKTEPADEKETQTPQPASTSSQHIPWYLQEESSFPETAEVSSRDQLPGLPENPPKILPELVEYIFKDLGLDELKFLDLRGLDHPAALGGSVIMILGTARSVKHLNVSADRLCRWLRSTYKLSPFADGLLGRNELKIKLRRRARRARVASRTGTMFDDKDDGITTGWICVNAGVVEKKAVPQGVAMEGKFEGFGPLVNGTRVVVQMFTAEKRADLDLETLWERRLARAEREREKYAESAAMDAPEEVRYPNSLNTSPSDYISPNLPRSPVGLPLEQRRHSHSHSSFQSPRPWHIGSTWRNISQSAVLSEASAEDTTSPSADLMMEYLKISSDDQIKVSLGNNPTDPNSTAFLRQFHNSLSTSPQNIVALFQLELMCMSYFRGLPAYSRENIHRAFMGCCISAADIPEELSNQTLSILLTPRASPDYPGEEWYTAEDRELALSVLDQLSLRGQDFLNLAMFTRLYMLACLPYSPGPVSQDGKSHAQRGAHILRMIESLDIPFEPRLARRLMFSMVRNGDYEAFWKWWRTLPLKGSPRIYDDYVMVFRMFAHEADEREARRCITDWVPMMQREDPPIKLEGELLNEVIALLKLCEADIQKKAEDGKKTPFVKLWRECQGLRSGYLLSIMEYLPALQQEFDDHKPSLFELLAEQQLSDLLPPSLRYILAVATHRHPRYLLRILNSYDEVYAVLSLIVERYYLRNFGGSFTENFYSLKRERVLLTKNGEIPRAQLGAPGPVSDSLKLRTSDVWKNLFVMVGIPYLKRKLDEGYDIHAAPQASLLMSGGPRYNPSDDLPPNPTIRQRLMHAYKWFLRNVYPSVNAAYYFSILAFNLAYLFDNTKYSSPFLWLIGTRIRRLSSADHHAISKILEGKPQNPRGARTRPGSGLLGLLSPQNLYPQALASLRYFLPASIFALKFLEWWHASDFSRQLARKATDTLDIPAPITKGMVPPSERKRKPSTSEKEKQDSSPKSALKSSSPSSKRPKPPISASSYLPIFTVSLPPADTDAASACPICLNGLTNPTACQTGYVYCYVCIFHWLNGEHQRQLDFMNGDGAGAAWEDAGEGDSEDGEGQTSAVGQSREGKWESGKGRCPVTGRRVLGGTEGLRRVLI